MYSDADTLSGGLPHSEIPGSTIARISPGLFAACHVLHRLSVPRHPPDALTLRLSATPNGKDHIRWNHGFHRRWNQKFHRRSCHRRDKLSFQKTLSCGTNQQLPIFADRGRRSFRAVTQLTSSRLSINNMPTGVAKASAAGNLGYLLAASRGSACRRSGPISLTP